MKKKQLFLAPIYGFKKGIKEQIKLNPYLLLRNIDLFKEEHKLFEGYGVKASCDAVLEVDYQYDLNDPSEPYPGISLNVINMFDSALLVYGNSNGGVGVAGIFPASKGSGGIVLHSSKVSYEDGLDKEIDEDFNSYYGKFEKAYKMRPLAFDIHRRSHGRFANNDRTIDSCTVLESLFIPKGERSKKSFILNGMKIMGFDTNDIILIDDLVEYRNAIIHADRDKQLKLLSGAKYTHKWFEETFVLIRKVLFKYVESPWS